MVNLDCLATFTSIGLELRIDFNVPETVIHPPAIKPFLRT